MRSFGKWLAQTRRPRLLIAIFSILSPLLLFLLLAPSAKPEQAGDYAPQVENLLAHGGFLTPEGRVLHRYPPLFPFLLEGQYRVASTLGVPRRFVFFAFALLCHLAAALLIFELARGWAAGLPAALLAALIYGCHPIVASMLMLPLSVIPFIPLLLAALWCLLRGIGVRADQPGTVQALEGKASPVAIGGSKSVFRHGWRLSLAMGILLGAAMLIRPIALFLPLLFAGLMLALWRGSWAHRIGCALMLLVAAVVTILPWEGFLYRHTGRIVPLSSSGVYSLRDGLSFNNKGHRERLALPADVEWLSGEIFAQYPNLVSTADVGAFIWVKFRERPLTVIKLYLIKAARAWYGTDSQSRHREWILLGLQAVFLAAALWGFWHHRGSSREARAFAWIALALIVYFWGFTTLVLSILRYMLPVFPLLAIYAALPMAKFLSNQ